MLIALAALGLRYVAPSSWADALSAVGYVFLAVWAYLELTSGANLFRRMLGAAGLGYVIVIIATRFTA